MTDKVKEAKPKLSLKTLSERLDGQDDKFDRLLLKVSEISDHITARPEVVPSNGEPQEEVKEKQKKKWEFYFRAMNPKGKPCTAMQVVLRRGHRKEFNPETGESELVPPIIADFGTEGPGPPGMWCTDDPEQAEMLRVKMKLDSRSLIEECSGLG